MSLGVGRLAALLAFATLSSAARAQSCDVDSDAFDNDRGRNLIWADCAAQAQPMAGSISSSDLEEAVDASAGAIDITTWWSSFQIDNLANQCVSRATFDVICAQHTALLTNEDGQCFLDGVFVLPAEQTLDNIGLARSLGARHGSCSALAVRATNNPMSLNTGPLTKLSISGSDSPDIIIESLAVADLTVESEMYLTGFVSRGDLVLDGVIGHAVNIKSAVVLGDLIIRGSTFERVRLEDVRVAGTLVFEGNVIGFGTATNVLFERSDVGDNHMEQSEEWQKLENDEFLAALVR